MLNFLPKTSLLRRRTRQTSWSASMKTWSEKKKRKEKKRKEKKRKEKKRKEKKKKRKKNKKKKNKTLNPHYHLPKTNLQIHQISQLWVIQNQVPNNQQHISTIHFLRFVILRVMRGMFFRHHFHVFTKLEGVNCLEK